MVIDQKSFFCSSQHQRLHWPRSTPQSLAAVCKQTKNGKQTKGFFHDSAMVNLMIIEYVVKCLLHDLLIYWLFHDVWCALMCFFHFNAVFWLSVCNSWSIESLRNPIQQNWNDKRHHGISCYDYHTYSQMLHAAGIFAYMTVPCSG